jgi:DNA polymerase III epsilon subunit-like protein
MITSIWCDTETTGIDPRESGAFEIAFLVYRGAEKLDEKLYRLNPLSDEVRFGEEAFSVNGVDEKTILSYPPISEVMPEVAEFLKKFAPPEKLVFAGYKCDFDYGHLGASLFRGGFIIGDYFNKEQVIDVYELVKKAAGQGLLPKTPNQKLETMTKSLGIAHDDAHTALSDIKATRSLYEAIYKFWRTKK